MVQDIRHVFAGGLMLDPDESCTEKFKFHDFDFNRAFAHEEAEDIMRGYRGACDYALKGYANAFVDNIMKSPFKVHRNDPIRFLDELAGGLHKRWLCAACAPVASYMVEVKIRSIWLELPRIFDLVDDEEL